MCSAASRDLSRRTPEAAPLKGSHRKVRKWTAVLAVVLVVALGGVIVSTLFSAPSPNKVVNPVRVSGTVDATRFGSIQFFNNNESKSTRYYHVARIIFGRYSITVSGGCMYTVYIGAGQTCYIASYTIYVPSNVTTYTANF